MNRRSITPFLFYFAPDQGPRVCSREYFWPNPKDTHLRRAAHSAFLKSNQIPAYPLLYSRRRHRLPRRFVRSATNPPKAARTSPTSFLPILRSEVVICRMYLPPPAHSPCSLGRMSDAQVSLSPPSLPTSMLVRPVKKEEGGIMQGRRVGNFLILKPSCLAFPKIPLFPP